MGGVYPQAHYSNEVRRYGGVAKLEFRPSDKFSSSVKVNYFQQDENERTDQGTLITFGPPPLGVVNGVLSFPAGPGINLRSQTWDVKKSLLHANWDLDYNWSDSNSTSFQAVYSEAVYTEVKPRIEIRGRALGAFTVSQDGGVTLADPTSLLDPAGYADTATRDFNISASNRDFTDDNSELYEFSLDHKINSGRDDAGFGAGFGARYRKTERKFDRIFEDYVGNTSARSTTNVGQILIPGESFIPRLSNYSVPVIDIASFNFDAARAGNDSDLLLTSVSTALTPGNGSFAVDEKVFATYGQVQHRGDRHLIIGGLRFEDTSTDALALDTSGATNVLVNRNGSYSNFLPSIMVQYELTDDLILRAAASRTLGRPGHAALSGAISTTVDAGGVTTTTQGNPDLKPRVSDNVDLSLEYYFPGGDGLLSMAVFHKNVQDEIFGRTTLLANGNRVTRPENVESARVTGLEIGVVKNKLEFLPGILSNFGVSANFSRFWGKTKISDTQTLDFLVEQPETIVNATLFFNLDGFEARLTYNRTDSFLQFGQPTTDFG